MPEATEIVRTVLLKAPISKVWSALSSPEQFGQWFRCTVDGKFAVGEIVHCSSLYEGSEEMRWQKRIVAIEPQRYFAYEWSPGETPADLYDRSVATTLVEFRLRTVDAGTELVIRESGFEKFSDAEIRRAIRLNTEGWDAQVNNIRTHLDGAVSK